MNIFAFLNFWFWEKKTIHGFSFGPLEHQKNYKFSENIEKTPYRRVAQKRYNFATGAANLTFFLLTLEKLGKFEIEELKMFRSPASGSAPISNQDDVTETERRFQIKK